MDRRAARAVALTFGLSWGAAVAVYLAGGRLKSLEFLLFGALYMWIPGLVALQLAQREGLRIPIAETPTKAWRLAIVVPMLLGLMAIPLSALFAPYVGFDNIRAVLPARIAGAEDPTLWFIFLVLALTAALTVNSVVALGEELMWRGYLWERLRGLGMWKASLVIGVVWGLWHTPLVLQGFNYPQHPVLGIGMMTAFTVLMTPWLLHLREAGGCVLAAALFHATFNAFAGFAAVVVVPTNDLLVGSLGVVGLALLALADVVLFLRLRAPGPKTPAAEPTG